MAYQHGTIHSLRLKLVFSSVIYVCLSCNKSGKFTFIYIFSSYHNNHDIREKSFIKVNQCSHMKLVFSSWLQFFCGTNEGSSIVIIVFFPQENHKLNAMRALCKTRGVCAIF